MTKKALEKKSKLNVGKMRKHGDVVAKHRLALAETGFECCAPCPGCSGKVQDGKMKCSRCGPTGTLITVEQASRCDGSAPFHTITKKKRFRPENKLPAA